MSSNEAGPSTITSSGKRPITARACDACRTRKLKCSGRPDTVDVNDAGVAIVPCEVCLSFKATVIEADIQHCREWKLECCYLYQRKRRGRRNMVVEKLAEQQRARRDSNGHRGHSSSGSERSPPPRISTMAQSFMVSPLGICR
jgi:hypothetical protein